MIYLLYEALTSRLPILPCCVLGVIVVTRQGMRNMVPQVYLEARPSWKVLCYRPYSDVSFGRVQTCFNNVLLLLQLLLLILLLLLPLIICKIYSYKFGEPACVKVIQCLKEPQIEL